MSSKRKTPVEQIFTQLRAARDKDSFGLGYGVSWLFENEQVYLKKEKIESIEFSIKFIKKHIKQCIDEDKPQEQIDLHKEVLGEMKEELEELKTQESRRLSWPSNHY
tara:strand:- start:2 stop:322 length:321 start_codon:yes stop_codon:yes gene_type:complete